MKIADWELFKVLNWHRVSQIVLEQFLNACKICIFVVKKLIVFSVIFF